MNLFKFPRRGYVESPTPLQRLSRFSEALGLGVDFYVKRDDLLPGCAGGNKTRKLDFSIARALELGAKALVTCGAVQSNHCRLTLAWAIREGLECHLVLEERVKESYDPLGSGNNFLYNLLEAHSLSVVPGGSDMALEMAKVAEKTECRGLKAYVIPGGAADPLGALGYVACAQELITQLYQESLDVSAVVCSSGSGGTHAGLLAGFFGTSTDIEVLGINVRRPKEEQEKVVRLLARDTAALLGLEGEIPARSIECFDEYLGPGYSIPTEETIDSIKLLARTEAILTDPVYTGKALAGLIGLARAGRFPKGSSVIFLHTGGAPALYSYLDYFQTASSGPPGETPK
jgi:D-cysteine desulfhydrase